MALDKLVTVTNRSSQPAHQARALTAQWLVIHLRLGSQGDHAVEPNENLVQDTDKFDNELRDEVLDRSVASICLCTTRKPED